MGRLLPFHRRMVQELIESDGLCVMAAGLGWQTVVAVIVRLQLERLRDPSEHGAILVVGCHDWQRRVLRAELERLAHSSQQPNGDEVNSIDIVEGSCDPSPSSAGLKASELPVEITNETPAAGRTELYQTRGCLFVTTRILVVDFLNSRLRSSQVAGIIVMNAHRVTDTSGEGFAIRLFRTSNQRGFVRGFTDNPVAVTAGFAKTEKIMKALFIRRLYIWPRWEAQVKDVLSRSTEQDIEVVELELEMTEAMTDIYEALTELLDSCIQELRRSNKIDSTQLTLENGLFKSFDDIVRRQLDSVWHTVSTKTKQLVNDLRTIRTLMEYLLVFDAVTYLQYLENLRATESVGAIWLFRDATHTIFEQAKRRVFALQQHNSKSGSGSKTSAAGKKRAQPDASRPASPDKGSTVAAPSGLVPVLEHMPKWRILCDIAKEIREERVAMSSQAEASGRDAGTDTSCFCLIVAQEARTCQQLREVVKHEGGGALLQRLYSAYLLHRLEGRKRAGSVGFRRGRRTGNRGRGRGQSDGRGNSNAMDRLDELRDARLSGSPAEDAALMSEARQLAAAHDLGKTAKGKGKGKAAKSKGQPQQQQAASNGQVDVENGDSAEEEQALLGFAFTSLENHDEGILEQLQPLCVVMYDPDIAFVRQLEVYKAQHPDRSLRVYNLRYASSLESDKYAAALTREQRAFEDLIANKRHMVLPDLATDVAALTQQPAVLANDGGPLLLTHPGIDPGSIIMSGGSTANALTRRAGGRSNTSRTVLRKVVVDVREFMSPLPAVLHQQGLDVIPVTLEVGDYILSPEICVERKSLSDLRQSFISGRLYHQASAMTRHYTTPVLLIEFQRDAAFILHAEHDIGPDIQTNSLISKLVLLTTHFPRLRVIWSRSLHATASIFAALKSNQDDPDAAAAALIGVPQGLDTVPQQQSGAAQETVTNLTAVEMLRQLPGVGDGNYRTLMAAAGSLAGLAEMGMDELQDAMGGTNAAKKLHDWLHAVCPRMP